MTTVQRVRDLAKEYHISLNKLAMLSGINYSTLRTTRERNGEYSVDTIMRICRALGISMSTFFEPWEEDRHAG